MYGQDFVDQILTSLRVISMIKEGQKVKVRNGLLDLEPISSGIRVAISRWINHDNRHSTILYIKNVVSNAMEIIRIKHSQHDKMANALLNSITGLGSLVVTYGEDASISATLQVLQERIKSEIKNTDVYINNDDDESRDGSN
jgi:hypothetical protein